MPGDKGFRYVYSPAHITTILDKIQNTGRPDKLNSSYIKNVWLLKNAQYSAVLDILKDMEFIDDSGTPLALYAQYQNPTVANETVVEGVKKAYPDLFKAYPKAYSQPKPTIEGYFKQQTGKTGSVLDKIVSTFYALCGLADFEAATEPATKPPVPSAKAGAETRTGITPVTVNVNIQLQLPATEDATIYESLFSALKRHLFP